MGADASEIHALSYAMRARAARAGHDARTAVEKACRDTEASAKAIAPVDTGFLRNSISSTVKGSGMAASGEVGPTAEYGGYVELGTSRAAPQPYLAPSFDRVSPGFLSALEQLGLL